MGRVVKVCGPRTYLIKTGDLIRARDKVPNELRELGIPVPKLCEQSDLSTGLCKVRMRTADADGGWRMADGGRRTADGGRRTADGGRRTADGQKK